MLLVACQSSKTRQQAAGKLGKQPRNLILNKFAFFLTYFLLLCVEFEVTVAEVKFH